GGAVGAFVMPPLAIAFGWRAAVGVSAAVVGGPALLPWLLSRDLPEPETASATATPLRASFWAVLGNRDLWLVGVSTLIFAGVQTVFLAFLVLYLHEAIRIDVVTAAKYLVAAQRSGAAGLIRFAPPTPPPPPGPWLPVPLAICIGVFGVGWNGVQHTLMAELAGPRAAGTAVGLGLAISSLGVTVCPPLFGLVVERVGGFTGGWV